MQVLNDGADEKDKYEKCLEELKKESTRWWRF